LVAPNVTSLAVEEYPTFWFFIPYQSTQVAETKFSLQDENNKDIYRTSFKAQWANILKSMD
jgi:Domain of Unknown Function (DUF928)